MQHRHTFRPALATGLFLLAAASACTGTIDSGAAPGGNGTLSGSASGARPGGTRNAGSPGGAATAPGAGTPAGTSGTPGSTPVPIPAGAPGPTAMRRLTNEEYRNTVQDLLMLAASPADPLMPDSPALGYDNFAASVSPVLGSQYATMATRLAGEANVNALAPCAAAGMESTCATSFINAFGKRAHRRPLAPADTQGYRAVYDVARMIGTYADGIKLVLETMLQSPYLLYRLEYGSTGAKRTLTSYEVASELAYLFTLSMPDPELLAAADANALATPTQVEVQARRLMKLPRAKAAVRKFVAQWMAVTSVTGLTKDSKHFPMFDENLKNAMAAESNRFIDGVLWERDGTVKTLLSAPFSYVNASLARIYGVPEPAGDTVVMATLNPRERAGIITQLSVLSVQSKEDDSFPIARGKFIRVRLMCQALPPPPQNVNITPPSPNSGLTTRERFAAHSSNPACAGCHALIDPVGFGMENYDAIGRYRQSENGRPIDARGELTGTDVDGVYTGGVELANKLAGSAIVRQCAAIQAARWAFGRPEIETDRATAKLIDAQFGAAGLDLRELLVATAKTESFFQRTLQP